MTFVAETRTQYVHVRGPCVSAVVGMFALQTVHFSSTPSSSHTKDFNNSQLPCLGLSCRRHSVKKELANLLVFLGNAILG